MSEQTEPTFGMTFLTEEELAELERQRGTNPRDEEDRARAEHIARMDAEDREPDGTHRDWYRVVDYVRYDPATGAILAFGQMSKAAVAHEDSLYDDDGYLIAKGHRDTHWVDVAAQELREKTACPAVLDGVTLRDLPVPCTITVTDHTGATSEHACTDGMAECEFEYPGTYTLTITSVPHLPGTYQVVIP